VKERALRKLPVEATLRVPAARLWPPPLTVVVAPRVGVLFD
jgi:hypothetical protein